jgi:transcriptional regulator with GAF, ATPase, and Fis domain
MKETLEEVLNRIPKPVTWQQRKDYLVLEALAENDWKPAKTAKILNMSRRYLYDIRKRNGVV